VLYHTALTATSKHPISSVARDLARAAARGN
jgi:hypothetical protein